MPISGGVNVDKVAQKVWEYSPRFEQYRSCVASDTLQMSANAERQYTNDAYGEVYQNAKEFVAPFDGTYRIKFDACDTRGIGSCLIDIRKNGVALIPEIATTSEYPTYNTFTNDIEVQAGDLIQVWVCPGNSSGYDVWIKNCRLYYTPSSADHPGRVTKD